MHTAPQNILLVILPWVWHCLKSPLAVILVRSVGAISSVLAATVAIFVDAEGIKKRATVDDQIRLKSLAREAWNDRFVRRVFIFIVIANLIFLFGDYLKDRATDDSNEATSKEIIKNNQLATGESGRLIVDHVTKKTDQINQEQEDIAQNAQTALDSIRESQNAFYDTRTDLDRLWQKRQGDPYPKICEFLNKWSLDHEKQFTLSTDPDVAPKLKTKEYMDDAAVLSDLKTLIVAVSVREKGRPANMRNRDRVTLASFSFPVLIGSARINGLYEVREAGLSDLNAGEEISFNSLAPDSCEEHLSLFSDALPDEFPDRSIPELAGKTLRMHLSTAEPQTYSAAEKTPYSEKRTSLWSISDIYFGDMMLVLDPAKLKETRDAAGKRYEFKFPTAWKELIALFDYRPYKRDVINP